MDLKRIEYLSRVAEYGSFSKAASVVGIAQPALGRQIKKLEAECGVQLLYRHGRGVSLTPEGKHFLEQAQPLVRQLEGITTGLLEERGSPTGQVMIGMTPTICSLLGKKLILATRQKYPKVRVNVVTGYSGYVHEWLIDARLDIAILHDARRSTHIAVEHLADASLSLVSSPGVLTSTDRAPTLPFQELNGLPLVLPSQNHGLRRTMELAASRAGFPLNLLYEVDSLALMKEMALSGLAHTVLALPAVQDEIKSGRLFTRQIVGPQVKTSLVLVKATQRPMTHAVRVIEQTTMDIFRTLSPKVQKLMHLKVMVP